MKIEEKINEYINEGRKKLKYGDTIQLKKNATVILSGTLDKKVPKRWINDGEWWYVDAYDEDTGMININRQTPYPGAFCSWVHEDDVK